LNRASFALWRFNWIHPFSGGNGRTSRAVAYLILCIDVGSVLPGVPTVPALIYERRDEYLKALRAADASERDTGVLDLSEMDRFLGELVTRQLASALDRLGCPT
jgi:Fic family protein